MSNEFKKITKAIFEDKLLKEFVEKNKLSEEDILNNLSRFYIQKRIMLFVFHVMGATVKWIPKPCKQDW